MADFESVRYASFLDELEKIAVSKGRMAVPHTRVGKRSMRVDTMLKKEKEGTLFKKAFKLQGSMKVQGLSLAIENRKGSVRSGVDPDGKPWSTTFKHPYGYIKGTEGKDGEEIDVYVGPDKKAPEAFVVHQRHIDGKGHDEDKVMLGFASEEVARKAYLDHYDKAGPKLLGPISTIAVDALRQKLEEKRKHTKLASSGSGPTGNPMMPVDNEEKPDRSKPGDVPSRDGTSPGFARVERHEAGPDAMTVIPTDVSLMSSTSGATVRTG